MAVRSVEVRLVGDASQYTGALKGAAGATRQFASEAKSAGQQINSSFSGNMRRAAGPTSLLGSTAQQTAGHLGVLGKAGQALGGIMGTAAGTFIGFTAGTAVVRGLASAFSTVVGGAIEFDRNMRNVQSITLQSDQSLNKMSHTILDLSTRLPQSAGELSAGLYDIASSGFKGAAAVEVLGQSAKAASAGVSDTATAAHAVVSVLNAYGQGAEKAKSVSDTLFAGVNVGVLTFSELSSTLGDVVGIAAQMGIPISDATGALAAMTLSGISAAESGTSLQRVIQSMIEPSDQLATLFHSWGFESGTAAIKTLGLQGVMEKIRTTTGGAADSMQALFPNVRALRGALALVAADGRNYDRAMETMSHAQDGAGATAKALAEQSKGLGYQLSLTKNQIMATGLSLGADLAPGAAAALGDLRDLAGQAADIASAFADQVSPGVDDVVQALSDLAAIAATAWDTLEPFVSFGGGVALTGAAEAFNLIGASVQAVTGFLHENEAIVKAVALLYGSYLAERLAVAAAEFAAMTAFNIAGWFDKGTAAVRAFALANTEAAAGSGGMALLKGGISGIIGLINPLTVGLAIAGAEIIAFQQARDRAGQKGDTFAKSITDAFKLDNLGSFERAIAAQARAHEGAQQLQRDYRGIGGAIKQVFGEDLNPFADNTGEENLGRIKSTRAEAERLTAQYRLLASNAKLVLNATSPSLRRRPFLTNETVQQVKDYEKNVRSAQANVILFADSIGVDLNQKGEKGRAAVEKVTKAMKASAEQAGYSKDAIAGMSRAQIAALTEDATAAQKYQQQVSDSFRKATDIISGLGNDPEKTTASGVTKFYTETVKSTGTFLDNIKQAYADGYDPGLISRILVSGPQAAGPLLDTLVKNAGDSFTKLVNDSEQKLAQLTAFASEVARLQQRALTGDATKAAQLPNAIQIQRIRMEDPTATVEDIAQKLKLTAQQVDEINQSYELGIPDIHVKVLIDQVTARGDLASIVAQMDAIPATITTTPDIRDPKAVKTWWANLRERLMQIPELRDTVAQITDEQDAYTWWTGLRARTDAIPRNVTTTVGVNDQAGPVIDALGNKLRTLNGQNATVGLTVNQTVKSWFSPQPAPIFGQPAGADGGFMRFADGGMHNARRPMGRELHQARIYPPGTTRVFNEPEAGGEAYVPMGQQKRATALPVVRQVADAFGYQLIPKGQAHAFADGGAWGIQSGNSGMGVTTATHQTYHQQFDMPLIFQAPVYGEDAMRRAVASMVDAAQAHLRRTVNQKKAGRR